MSGTAKSFVRGSFGKNGLVTGTFTPRRFVIDNGNLLCAVAGLLDNTGVLTQVKQILNSILAILRL